MPDIPLQEPPEADESEEARNRDLETHKDVHMYNGTETEEGRDTVRETTEALTRLDTTQLEARLNILVQNWSCVQYSP